jgi:hypothetical protein
MHEAALRLFLAHWSSIRNVLVASLANDHRFTLVGCHQYHPLGLWLSALYVEVFQRSDVMHLTSFM